MAPINPNAPLALKPQLVNYKLAKRVLKWKVPKILRTLSSKIKQSNSSFNIEAQDRFNTVHHNRSQEHDLVKTLQIKFDLNEKLGRVSVLFERNSVAKQARRPEV